MLFSGALISNSLFIGNEAVGTGANSVDAAHCACAGNQVGSGGNGGGLYKDGGDGQDIVVCGSQFTQNSAKEFGAAIFLTVLAYNLIGEGLQEATDPRLRQAGH